MGLRELMDMVTIFQFCLRYYWLLFCLFQIQGNASPQANYNLQQFGNLHPKVELKHLPFPLPDPSRNGKLRGSQQLYQVNKEGHLLTDARISKYFGETSKREEFIQICKAKSVISAWHCFPGAERPFKGLV